MNHSFDPLNLVNTYGAFGTVGRERTEIVFEGTMTCHHRRHEMEGVRIQSQARRPESAPTVRRALSAADRLADLVRRHGFAGEYPWTSILSGGCLHNDPGTLSLIAKNPFPNATAALHPRAPVSLSIRADRR